MGTCPDQLTAADRWILARAQEVTRRVTAHFDSYDYASAKNEIEGFFWADLADNYLEMAKLRLYAPDHPQHAGACYALRESLRTAVKLLAPLLPYITEAVYQELFAVDEGRASVHAASWPEPDPALEDEHAARFGENSRRHCLQRAALQK